MSKNERKTEIIVRGALRKCGYYRTASKLVVEEQKSEIAAVKRLLKASSKSGQGGAGSAEFIVSCEKNPDFLVIVECKADTRDHISDACKAILEGREIAEESTERAKRTEKFGVDGVLHYAKSLSKEFNVIAVAVSGETEGGARISTYLHVKGNDSPKLLQTKEDKKVDQIIPWDDYIEHATYDPTVQRLRQEELMEFSRDLHVFMRDHAKLTENEKPLLVSGTL